MDYIMINESKLKIMLEAKDLENWDIQIDELDYSNPYAKIIFEEILSYAKENFGFDAAGRKVLLQLYPSRDGGCELFITRLGESSECKKENTISNQTAYSFEKISHLLSVCKLLHIDGFSKNSSAWFDNSGKWFLVLSGDDSAAEDSSEKDKFIFISEYGEKESPQFLSLYLHEHAFLVCEDNAVETLGKI